MRPIATSQDGLQFPLNDLLGTEAHVRILRVLSVDSDPIGAPDIAEQAEMSLPGARKALKRLSKTGRVVRYGTGRQQLYALRPGDPIIAGLVKLFDVESLRYESLLSDIRRSVSELSPPPYSVWIIAADDLEENILTLGLLSASSTLMRLKQELRKKLYFVEQEHDLTIEIRGFTKADLPTLATADSIIHTEIAFDQPNEGAGIMLSHDEVDARSIERSVALVSLVNENPALISKARHHVRRLLRENQGTANQDLQEWVEILESYSKQRLLKFLTSQSERAYRLRQSSPFYAILSPYEREFVRASG